MDFRTTCITFNISVLKKRAVALRNMIQDIVRFNHSFIRYLVYALLSATAPFTFTYSYYYSISFLFIFFRLLRLLRFIGISFDLCLDLCTLS